MMKNKLKFHKTLLALLGLVFCFPVLSSAQEHPTEWTVYKKVKGITIEYKYADCDLETGFSRELVFLRMKNTTNKTKDISWLLEAYYGENCKTCDYPGEYTFQLELRPNTQKEGVCSVKCDPRLKIFSKWTNPRFNKNKDLLSDFKLTNINVSCEDCE